VVVVVFSESAGRRPEVLKELDPDQWDNEAVDELLAAADKNGDEELSIKEFLTLGFKKEL